MKHHVLVGVIIILWFILSPYLTWKFLDHVSDTKSSFGWCVQEDK